MSNKVALVTGASRGIGKAICLGLAEKGYNIVVVSKSITSKENLPGTIYETANEVEKHNVKALPIKADLRHDMDINNVVQQTKQQFGKIDVLVNNAGALWWKNIQNTPSTKYDLVNQVNARASYVLSRSCIDLMSDGGHIIMQSPPIPDLDTLKTSLKGKTAYMISKLGMTMTALGISEEYKGTGIACNTLWPMTPIESFAVKNYNLGNEKMWRKPDILVDSVKEIVRENPRYFTGFQLIDEVYLRKQGYTNFMKYQCVPGYEPPRLDKLYRKWKS